VLIDNLIFGIDGDENSKPALRCVDSAKGKVLWSESSIGAGTLIAAEGGKQLIVLSDNGELHLLTPSAESFDSQASAQVFSGKCWTAPTLANGNLYLRNAAGDLAAFDLKPQ
jgi:outer membrane protein assembly factor BamB